MNANKYFAKLVNGNWGLVLLFLVSCNNGDPVEMQIVGKLKAIRGLAPMFFDHQGKALLHSIPINAGSYLDITDEFGKSFEKFVVEHTLEYSFDAKHRLLDAGGHPIEIMIKREKIGIVSLRFVAHDPVAAGDSKKNDLVVELESILLE